MCETACFTHLLFSLGCQGKHVIHDSWIQLCDPGRLAIGRVPFVFEDDGHFFPLLDGQILHPVASEFRPGDLLSRHEQFVIVQEYFLAQARGHLMLRFDILKYPPKELPGAWKKPFHQLIVHKTLRGDHPVPDPELRIQYGVGGAGDISFLLVAQFVGALGAQALQKRIEIEITAAPRVGEQVHVGPGHVRIADDIGNLVAKLGQAGDSRSIGVYINLIQNAGPPPPRKVIGQALPQASEEFDSVDQLSPDDEMKVIAHDGECENVDIRLLRQERNQVDGDLPLFIAFKYQPVLERFRTEMIKGTGFAEQLFLHPFDLPLGWRGPFDILFHRCKPFCSGANIGKPLRNTMDSVVVSVNFLCF